MIGSTGPPLERAPVSSARIVNSLGNSIDYTAVGEQIRITSDVANGQNREQKYVSRATLCQELNLGEGSVKTLISHLKKSKYSNSIRAGTYLLKHGLISPEVLVELEFVLAR